MLLDTLSDSKLVYIQYVVMYVWFFIECLFYKIVMLFLFRVFVFAFWGLQKIYKYQTGELLSLFQLSGGLTSGRHFPGELLS